MSSLGNFVWSIADQLRGVYKPHQYGNVVLPMTILRRLDCLLEPTRDRVCELAETTSNDEVLKARVKRELGLNFYNTSPWTLKRLVGDPDALATNLVEYIAGFSANVDVFDRFKFENEITAMAEKNRLLLVVTRFSEVDLHPDKISNADMGDLFEELIRKFAEASNETAGEHFTPRDAIRLMADLLFAEDGHALSEPGIVRSVYDPTAGTGGMLSVAEEHLLSRNPGARLRLYGQERGLRADRRILTAKVERQAAAIADLKEQVATLEHQRQRWLGTQLHADASIDPEAHSELRISNERLIAENASLITQVAELRRINSILEADLAASRQAHAEDVANLLSDTDTSVTTLVARQ